MTATEEFGIAAVEAQASGRPVIALRDGGVLETVLEGETGVFYAPSRPAALAQVVQSFDPSSVDPARCIRNAERFASGRFRASFHDIVEDARSGGLQRPGAGRRPMPRVRVGGLALQGRGWG